MLRRTSPLVVLALALLGAPAMAIETPTFEVVKRYAEFEVRQYPSVLVAETEVTGTQEDVGNEAFSRLAGYIFGNNRGAKKIAMTAPVTQTATKGTTIAMTAPVTQQRAGTGTYRVQFTMPAAYTLDTLPEPTDARVHLRQLEPRRFAALRYSGTWSRSSYEEHLEKLRAAMKREGLEARGEPVWARYDPPFKPWFLRRNEILIEVG